LSPTLRLKALADSDALAMAEVVEDLCNALELLRAAQGFGRITVELTMVNGVITRWEIAPHISKSSSTSEIFGAVSATWLRSGQESASIPFPTTENTVLSG
jgi:hypothetical protein